MLDVAGECCEPETEAVTESESESETKSEAESESETESETEIEPRSNTPTVAIRPVRAKRSVSRESPSNA